MSRQHLPLWEIGLSRARDPETSKEAAGSVDPRSDCGKILEWLRGRGSRGATDQEIQVALGLPANTQPTRRNQLVRAGKVRDSGRKRQTVSGRRAIVWEATQC